MNDKKYIENFNHESYENRTKNYLNISEDRFVQYCTSRGYLYRKLGLNAVSDSQSFAESVIPLFAKLPTLIKSFPDYFVYAPKEASVDQILKLLPKSQLKCFPNDNIEYFEVQLN